MRFEIFSAECTNSFRSLFFAASVFGGGDADDFLELVHEVDIVAVTALVCDISDAVIGAGEETFGELDARIDDILCKADSEASGIELLEIAAAED